MRSNSIFDNIKDIDSLGEKVFPKRMSKSEKVNPFFFTKISSTYTFPQVRYSQNVIVKVSYNYFIFSNFYSSRSPEAKKAKINTTDAIDYFYRFEDENGNGIEGISSDGIVDDYGNPVTKKTNKEMAKKLFPNDAVFKIMISPENGKELDDYYIKKIMKALSEKVGKPLKWTAVIHTNTEHRHAHILVSRTSPPFSWEKPLILDKDFVKKGIRELCVNMSDAALGRKSLEEYREPYYKTVLSPENAKIDYDIIGNINKKTNLFIHKENGGKDYYLSQTALSKLPEWKQVLVKERLEYLSTLNIGIIKNGSSYYATNDTWMDTLRERKIKKAFEDKGFKEIDKIIPLTIPLEKPIHGTVVATEIVDENSGSVNVLYKDDKDGSLNIIKTNLTFKEVMEAEGKGIVISPNTKAKTRRYRLPIVNIGYTKEVAEKITKKGEKR